MQEPCGCPSPSLSRCRTHVLFAVYGSDFSSPLIIPRVPRLSFSTRIHSTPSYPRKMEECPLPSAFGLGCEQPRQHVIKEPHMKLLCIAVPTNTMCLTSCTTSNLPSKRMRLIDWTSKIASITKLLGEHHDYQSALFTDLVEL